MWHEDGRKDRYKDMSEDRYEGGCEDGYKGREGTQAQLHDSLLADVSELHEDPNSVIRDVKSDTLSDYVTLQYLGIGGFAVVDSVEYKGKIYARKTFDVKGDMNRARQSFKTEVSILKKLSEHRHQHIVHFADAFTCEEKKGLYLLMSPVANEGNLQHYLRALYYGHNGLNEDTKLFLRDAIKDLARGLAFIHQTTVRHKDISPLNILIHNGRVLYADFGVAFDFCSANTSTTDSIHPLYNFQYAAPELHARQPRNHKSDIFSLGCVYFEIIAIYFDTRLKTYTIYEEGLAYGQPESVDKLQEIGRYGTIGDLCASMLRKTRDARPIAAQVESNSVGFDEKVELRSASELGSSTLTSVWHQQNQAVSSKIISNHAHMPSLLAFYDLTNKPHHLSSSSGSYWRHLTVDALSIYTKIYEACKDHDGNVSFFAFQNQFRFPEPTSEKLRSVWLRLKHTVDEPMTRNFILATVYMLHVEKYLNKTPKDNSGAVGIARERRKSVKRFGNWVDCSCDLACSRRWNFANDLGLSQALSPGQECKVFRWVEKDESRRLHDHEGSRDYRDTVKRWKNFRAIG